MTLYEESKLVLAILPFLGFAVIQVARLSSWKISMERDIADIRKQSSANKSRDERIESKLDRHADEQRRDMKLLDSKLAALQVQVSEMSGHLRGAGVMNGKHADT